MPPHTTHHTHPIPPPVPYSLPARSADPAEVSALVGFLEDRHIRLLPVDERAPLRRPGAEWDAAFEAYLRDAGCPLLAPPSRPYHTARLLEFLRWLVNYAVGLAYEDDAGRLNAEAAAELAQGAQPGDAPASAPAAPAAAALPPVPPAVDALVRQLAAQLHVASEGRDALQILQAVHRALRQRVLPVVSAADKERKERAAAAVAAEGAASGTDAAAASSLSAAAPAAKRAGAGRAARPGPVPWSAEELLDLSRFPLGFTTGDALADKASAVLRMLYITDLRELQDAVNDLLVTVQEFTANPKTDASLGVVGR